MSNENAQGGMESAPEAMTPDQPDWVADIFATLRTAVCFGKDSNAYFNWLERHIPWDNRDDDCSLYLHAVDRLAYTLT